MRRIDGFLWPGLFLLTVLIVLFLVINPELLTGKKLYQSDIVDERQNPVSAYASANRVAAGSDIRQIAFKAHLFRLTEITQNLKIALHMIRGDMESTQINFEKMHDQQFVKSSSGLCPGAYEHAL